MIPQTQTILNSYFQTGDKPTQAQFAEMIDTFFYLSQIALDTSAAAAAQILATTPDKSFIGKVAGAAIANLVTQYKNFGIASAVRIQTGAGFNAVQLNFTAPFADALYAVELYNCTIRVQNTNYVQVNLQNANPWSVSLYRYP